MENLIKNKHFITTKYFVATILVLASIFSLVAAWYSGLASYWQYTTAGGGTGNSSFIKETANGGLRGGTMAIGILGLLIAVGLFANRNNYIAVLVLMALAVIFIILSFALGGHSITDTSTVKTAVPDQTTWEAKYPKIPYDKVKH